MAVNRRWKDSASFLQKTICYCFCHHLFFPFLQMLLRRSFQKLVNQKVVTLPQFLILPRLWISLYVPIFRFPDQSEMLIPEDICTEILFFLNLQIFQ